MTAPTIDPGNEVNRNPARTSVRDIMARIARTDGYGLRENEVRKLAAHVEKLEALCRARAIGWYPDEREYLTANGVL